MNKSRNVRWIIGGCLVIACALAYKLWYEHRYPCLEWGDRGMVLVPHGQLQLMECLRRAKRGGA